MQINFSNEHRIMIMEHDVQQAAPPDKMNQQEPMTKAP